MVSISIQLNFTITPITATQLKYNFDTTKIQLPYDFTNSNTTSTHLKYTFNTTQI